MKEENYLLQGALNSLHVHPHPNPPPRGGGQGGGVLAIVIMQTILCSPQ